MNQDNTKNILNQKNNITQHKNEINRLYKVEVGLEDKVIFSVASICMGLTAVVTFIAFNLLPLLCVGIPAVIVGFCLMTKYSLKRSRFHKIRNNMIKEVNLLEKELLILESESSNKQYDNSHENQEKRHKSKEEFVLLQSEEMQEKLEKDIKNF